MKMLTSYSAAVISCLLACSTAQVRFANEGPIGVSRAPILLRAKSEPREFTPFPVQPPRFEPLTPSRPLSPVPLSSLAPSAAPPRPRQQEPTFRPVSFRQPSSPQQLRPTRPSPTPASVSGSRPHDRSHSRFQPTQEDKLIEPDYEDYSDEPDKLSILLAESTFQCDPSDTGYFSDDSVNCEVFHYCSQGVKHSWVCPEGNIFHQINLICQPPSSDNICERSNDFHFVNDYLYQLVRNDSARPEYADRFYPENYHQGSRLEASSAQRQPITFQSPPETRRRVQAPVTPRPFSAEQELPRFQDQTSTGFRAPVTQQQQPSSSVSRLSQQAVRRLVAERPRPAFLRPHAVVPAAEFPQAQSRRERAREPVQLQPLPPVRPAANPFPKIVLNPSIHSRGAPLQGRHLQERQDRLGDIVVGGFQGNVDIHDLASRNAHRF